MLAGDPVRLLIEHDGIPVGTVGTVLGVVFGYPDLADDIAVRFDGKSLVVPAEALEPVAEE